MDQQSSQPTSFALEHYRILHDIYVLLDDGDRFVLEPFNLSQAQFNLLLKLDTQDGKRLTTISQKLLYSKSQVTRLVDQLEHMGLVKRVADPDDRRAQRVVLTQAGEQRRDKAQLSHFNSLQNRLSILNLAEQQQLRSLLNKLRDGLSQTLTHRNNHK